MVFVSAQSVQYTFSGAHTPAAVIRSGDTVRLETLDCFSNRLRSGVWQPTPREVENPATGPVFVEGAHPGSMLRVDVLDIHLEAFGVVESVAGSGCLGAHVRRNTARAVPMRDGCAYLTETLNIPVRPMIGVLGVAPASGAPMTMLPGPHGGNMDCTRITVGSTVFLPVFAEGALLAAGDLHAAMGDGEIGVSGLEIPGEVTLRLTAEDRFQLPFPVVIQGENIYAVASAPSLDDACEQAAGNLFRLICEAGGISEEDAVPLLTLAGDLHVCQIVNPLKTACMSLDLKYLNLPWRDPAVDRQVPKEREAIQ